MWETWVWSLGREDPLEKEMATHSSTLAWKILWMEHPGRLQSMGWQRVGHNWATSLGVVGWEEELGVGSLPQLSFPGHNTLWKALKSSRNCTIINSLQVSNVSSAMECFFFFFSHISQSYYIYSFKTESPQDTPPVTSSGPHLPETPACHGVVALWDAWERRLHQSQYNHCSSLPLQRGSWLSLANYWGQSAVYRKVMFPRIRRLLRDIKHLTFSPFSSSLNEIKQDHTYNLLLNMCYGQFFFL